MSELTLTVSEVQSVLEALDVTKATQVHRELQAHLLTMTCIQSLEAMCIQHFKDILYEVVRDCQHEFIRGKSCTSNLLEVLDHVGSLRDDGEPVDMTYMDMSKAFDKVNHGCLLQKFHEFGFGGSPLQWFSSESRGINET